MHSVPINAKPCTNTTVVLSSCIINTISYNPLVCQPFFAACSALALLYKKRKFICFSCDGQFYRPIGPSKNRRCLQRCWSQNPAWHRTSRFHRKIIHTFATTSVYYLWLYRIFMRLSRLKRAVATGSPTVVWTFETAAWRNRQDVSITICPTIRLL